MIFFDEDETRERLPWRPLIEALREAFRGGIESPAKHQHYVPVPGEPEAKIMMMPAWRAGDYVCVKLVNLFPGNGARDLPAVSGLVVLFDGRTGQPLAQLDGGEVTARRTAATSALAADYLALDDARTHLVVGTGRVAWNLVLAYRAVRPIERTLIWGRNPAKSRRLAAAAGDIGIRADAVEDLERAVRDSDIVSTATLSSHPLVRGDWLAPGAHLDLVGGYRPEVREADDIAVRRATIFCDTMAGAPKSAGDLTQPIASGLIRMEDLVDLHALVRGEHRGRSDDEEITFFKSVGAALEDFAAAAMAYERTAEMPGRR